MGLGLPTGAAGSRFDATKRHVDSTTLRRQGRVIPLISQKRTSWAFGLTSNGPGAIRPDEIQTDGSAD